MCSSFAASAFISACLCLAQTAPKMDMNRAEKVCRAVENHSLENAFDPYVIGAMAWVESRFNPGAVSRSGARGVMQVLLGRRWSPDYTAEQMLDPDLSVEAGVLMAARWRQKDPVKWIECYNSGTRCRNGAYAASVERTRLRLVSFARSDERGRFVGEVIHGR